MSGAEQDHVRPADAEDVLDRLCGIPITTWNYRKDDPSIRHIGPMAQDFHATFGVGTSEKVIHVEDAMGVAFASIQALKARLDAQSRRLEELRAEIDRLESGGAA